MLWDNPRLTQSFIRSSQVVFMSLLLGKWNSFTMMPYLNVDIVAYHFFYLLSFWNGSIHNRKQQKRKPGRKWCCIPLFMSLWSFHTRPLSTWADTWENQMKKKKKKDNIIAFHSLSSSMRNLEAQRRMVHNTLFRIQKSNSTTNKHIFFTYNQGKKKEFQAFDS